MAFAEKSFADAKRIWLCSCLRADCSVLTECVCMPANLRWIMDPMIDFYSHTMKNARHKSYNF